MVTKPNILVGTHRPIQIKIAQSFLAIHNMQKMLFPVISKGVLEFKVVQKVESLVELKNDNKKSMLRYRSR